MVSMNKETDRDVLKISQSEDFEVFRRLYIDHYQGLCARAFLIVKDQDMAEDIVQDLFAKLWQSKSSYHYIQQPEAYLNQALRNACFDYLKKNKSIQTTDDFESSVSDIDLFEMVSKKEIMGQLHVAMQELPEQCRKIFDLVYLQGKKYQEAAEQMQVSINTVKTQLKRGLSKLREQMKQYK